MGIKNATITLEATFEDSGIGWEGDSPTDEEKESAVEECLEKLFEDFIETHEGWNFPGGPTMKGFANIQVTIVAKPLNKPRIPKKRIKKRSI